MPLELRTAYRQLSFHQAKMRTYLIIRLRKQSPGHWVLGTGNWVLATASCVLLLSTFLLAEGTRIWEQSKFDDLSKGTATGIALRSAGGLELAPAFKTLSTTPSTYIWSIAADQAGNLYAAAGAPARVYRINPAGQATVIFEPQELQVQAVLVDKNGAIYAATNPDGKIYKIENHPKADAATTTTTTKDNSEKTKSSVDSAWSSTVYFDRPRNTSGTWHSTRPAISTPPPAIKGRFFASPPKVSIRFSSRAMKLIFESWRSMLKPTLSPVPTAAD